jgi:transposase
MIDWVDQGSERMGDKDLYAQLLGVTSPWQVTDVKLAWSQGTVTVHVGQDPQGPLCCPTCAQPSPGFDSRPRHWHALDTCQYRTILVADVPRVRCAKNGVVTSSVPWPEPGSGFTALFEALVIDWLKEASVAAVARIMGLSWNAIDGVMQRAVARGLLRRATARCTVVHLGDDEPAFRKRRDDCV